MHTSSRNNWKCNCPRCENIIQRRRSGLLLALLCLGLVLIASIVATAQTAPPFTTPAEQRCILRPATILTTRPAPGPVNVVSRLGGWPRAVDAIHLISSISHIDHFDYRSETASAVIQYTMAIDESNTLRNAPISTWIDRPDVPALPLWSVVRTYLWTGNPQQRSLYGYWLTQIVASSTNDYCNR